MEYISTKEASEKWGISTIRITILANEGRIPGARRLGKSWLIPASATKPESRKPNHSESKKEVDSFSFPLYHFRPDYSYIQIDKLSNQHQSLLSAEGAVLECRFADAYTQLKSIYQSTDDIVTEIGVLFLAGLCCIGLNEPESFSRISLKLQSLLSEDFPHRDDLIIILDALNTYIESLGSVSKHNSFNTDINEQCLPLSCLNTSYTQLTKEAMNPGSVDVVAIEYYLRFLKNTGAIIVIEIMHLHLVGIYFLRNDMTSAEKHAAQAIQLAYENNYYYPLVTYYSYFAPILSSILSQYPEDFQKHCYELVHQYNENLTAFMTSIDEFHTLSQLTDADYPYIYAVLMDLPNTTIAERQGISTRTVKRRLDLIYKKLGVSNKKELKDYLHNFM